MSFNYKLLDALQAVLSEGNFQRAARKLAITQSGVSQRIRELEEQFGTPLLVRDSPPRATPAGQILIQHLSQVQLMEASLSEALSSRSAQTSSVYRIPVALNSESLSTWFLDAVAPILEEGGLLLDLHVDDQDRTLGLLREGKVLACVASTSTASPGCLVSELGAMRYKCVASPKFVGKYFSKKPLAKELYSAPAAIYGEFDRLHEEYLTKHFPLKGAPRPCYVLVPSPEGLIKYASLGFAYSILPDVAIAPLLKRGILVDLFPDREHVLKLYWHRVSIRVPALENLTKQVVAFASKHLGS